MWIINLWWMFQVLEISNYILCWVIIHCHNTHSSYGYLLYSINEGKKVLVSEKTFHWLSLFSWWAVLHIPWTTQWCIIKRQKLLILHKNLGFPNIVILFLQKLIPWRISNWQAPDSSRTAETPSCRELPRKLGFTLKQGFILFIVASMEESIKYSWVLLHVENHRQISAPGRQGTWIKLIILKCIWKLSWPLRYHADMGCF